MVVQFDSRDGCARFGQGLGQGADARPDFQDRIALPDFGSVGNIVDDGVTDEKILSFISPRGSDGGHHPIRHG